MRVTTPKKHKSDIVNVPIEQVPVATILYGPYVCERMLNASIDNSP